MFQSFQKFILTIFFTVFAAQVNAMFVQPDWLEVTEPGVGTNRYSYSGNDPVNKIDPNGNKFHDWGLEQEEADAENLARAEALEKAAAKVRSRKTFDDRLAGLLGAAGRLDRQARDHRSRIGLSMQDRAKMDVGEVLGQALMGLRPTGGIISVRPTPRGSPKGPTGTPVFNPTSVSNKVPSNWTSRPNRKGAGTRYVDPTNAGNRVRVDQGNRNHSHPSQRVDHVVVQKDGKVIERDGQPISGSIRDNAVQAHVPLSEYSKWGSWSSP